MISSVYDIIMTYDHIHHDDLTYDLTYDITVSIPT